MRSNTAHSGVVRTRFAPSPTGRLHLGHVLAAQVAHDLARREGGGFLLRHEDIDGTRVREDYYAGIEEDLRWLGLAWDGPALRQSTRIAAYEGALERLRAMGLVYPCYCTRREIQDEVGAMVAAPQGPAHWPGVSQATLQADGLHAGRHRPKRGRSRSSRRS